MAQREPIGVIGTGYVGLVTAAGFAELGSDVFCIDIDQAKIDGLKAGRIPIWEPGLAELVEKNRERMHFSTDIADALEGARLLFVAVGTPPTYSGDADLSAVHAVVNAMPPSDTHALVMKSTVPCGTGVNIKRVFEEQGKAGFKYVSCPEFLKEGSAVQDFLHPDRVVVGDDGDWAGDAVCELYAPLGAPLVRTDIQSAEMVKLASNAFLATKISFINEIANVCEETGADVLEVARGMGLDDRIGPKFLQAGIGFGGSCLPGEETVLARLGGRTTVMRLDELWRRMEERSASPSEGVLEIDDLDVLAWDEGHRAPVMLPVTHLTCRAATDGLVEVRTKMGRRIRTTPDHPFVVRDGADATVKRADELTTEDRLPLALGGAEEWEPTRTASLLLAADAAEISPRQLIVRPPADELRKVAGAAARGVVRLDEAQAAVIDTTHATFKTARNGTEVPNLLQLDERFWRVVGLYLAEGHATADRLHWSVHPTKEQHLVDEVKSFWMANGVAPRDFALATAHEVRVQSRLLVAWWTQVLGLGRNAYEQRLPDLVWDRPARDKWALLSGLFEGDGSWSLVNGGPSVVVELGTVSDELADGVLRLLADLGVVASLRIGRTATSTKDTHWIRIGGADQVERAIALVPERDRTGVLTSIGRQAKRIASTGCEREGDGTAWVRVVDVRPMDFEGDVFSLEVPYAHTFVTTGGLAVHNCFPKDVTALKQLAGNSGYHFQLLNSVIEVNELQKRRVMRKLEKHLGSLVDKRIALLGLAFKPNTDDMREASSLVLSARLQAAGATVVAYDPVAEEEARKLIHGVEFAASAMECVAGADAVVLVTEWGEFLELDLQAVAGAMAGELVVDGRNALDPAAVRAAGLRYEGIGRG
jgi:UDPglucose 6-dehydrogenase